MKCPDDIEWIVSENPVGYAEALTWMERRAAGVASGIEREAIWLLEHPALYTAGTSADPTELRNPAFPVFQAGRGGRYTYHGPGQRIVYLVLDLNKRGRDVRCFVSALEGWMIAALGRFGIAARREPGRIGIWVDDPVLGEAKIGAIGVRVKRWITMHGFSINLDPDLSHFSGIVPCGISEFGVTSARRLGSTVCTADFDEILVEALPQFLMSLRCNNPLERGLKKS